MNWWIDRQRKDFFVKERKKRSLISRSYFKLKEINNKFNLIAKGKRILDLGSSPGGWTQYLLEHTEEVTSIDINDNFLLKGSVKFYRMDVFDEKIKDLGKFDGIISDILANTTGNRLIDSANSLRVFDRIIQLKDMLSSKGFFIIKVLESEDLNNRIKSLNLQISKYKPNSSRSESREIYIICRL